VAEVTYGRLDEVLRSLGFAVQSAEDNAQVYRHEGTGALIVLPTLVAGERVLPRHLVAVRMTLDAYGIADPLDLDSRLQKAS
jgi:hypothetical protein